MKNIDINIDIDIDKVILENIDIDKAILDNIDIDIDKDNPENIDKDNPENIDIDKTFFKISRSMRAFLKLSRTFSLMKYRYQLSMYVFFSKYQ